jgi:hypothetical protein
MQRFRH